MRDTRIPLFPLNVVLLPGASLPLHIFEPRYRLMVRHCLTHKTEFGMILAQDSNVATVGCTAQIVQTLRAYPTGESDILTEGRAVFRALDLFPKRTTTKRSWNTSPTRPIRPKCIRKMP